MEKDTVNQSSINDRNKKIVNAGAVSIIVNIILAFSKALIGIITKSLSITLDAVNNFSDAISGAVTILGAKLSSKEPDAKHPLGYGRIEYISAMIVAGLVLYAGITSIIESVKKIITPSAPSYSRISLFILAGFIIVKLLLSKYIKGTGKKLNSMSLIASGKDAGFDAVLSLSVLISILIYIKTGILLEAYIGIIISIIIIKSGIEMMIETIDEILGKRVDKDLSDTIKNDIIEDKDVLGAYDLIINSYGPDTKIGSVHIEVEDTMNADEIDIISRRIAYNIYKKHGILLTGIGIYSKNTQDEEIEKIQSDIENIAMSHKGVLQVHGFYMNKKKKLIALDIILDYNMKNRNQIYEDILNEVKEKYSEYNIYINMDIDI